VNLCYYEIVEMKFKKKSTCTKIFNTQINKNYKNYIIYEFKVNKRIEWMILIKFIYTHYDNIYIYILIRFS